MIPHMMEHSTLPGQQQPNQQPAPPPSSSLAHGSVMSPQMSAPAGTVSGGPGTKSGLPPNLPQSQLPTTNPSGAGQMQQVRYIFIKFSFPTKFNVEN